MEALRFRYLSERGSYEKLANSVAERMTLSARSSGIRCDVTHRVKDVSSFLKKALKEKYSDPFDQIKDKAGVRVVAHHPWDIDKLETLVAQEFTVCDHDDKRAALSFQTLDYRGTHFEIKHETGPPQLRNQVCEIQVLTKAESLWADTAHYLSYKPIQSPSDPVRRSIYRLIALLEIFDVETERAYRTLCSDERYEEARLLDILEHHYLKFASKQSDRGLSLQVLSVLRKVPHDSAWQHFESSMRDFVDANEDKLIELYERYLGDDAASLLIWQPEALLIFLLLEADRFSLRDVWEVEYPLGLLSSLADSWGAPIPSRPSS